MLAKGLYPHAYIFVILRIILLWEIPTSAFHTEEIAEYLVDKHNTYKVSGNITRWGYSPLACFKTPHEQQVQGQSPGSCDAWKDRRRMRRNVRYPAVPDVYQRVPRIRSRQQTVRKYGLCGGNYHAVVGRRLSGVDEEFDA